MRRGAPEPAFLRGAGAPEAAGKFASGTDPWEQADPWSLSQRPLASIEPAPAPALPPGRVNRRWMRAAESCDALKCQICAEWQIEMKKMEEEIAKSREVLGNHVRHVRVGL